MDLMFSEAPCGPYIYITPWTMNKEFGETF